MNTEHLNACIGRLKATYPGDWPDGRQAVWSEALEPLDFETAVAAIKGMAADTEFPTIAALNRQLKPTDAGIVERNGCRFTPGTGWMPCHPDDVEGIPRSETLADLPALEAPPMTEERARAYMAQARRRIEAGRRAMQGDPEVRGKVDALAAALRLPEGNPDA